MDPYVKSRRLIALATTGASRSPQLPDVPTFTELGMPEVEIMIWTGMAGPAGLPPEIVERLYVELSKVLRNPPLNRAVNSPIPKSSPVSRKRSERFSPPSACAG